MSMKPTPIAVFLAFMVALFLLLPLIAVVPVSFTPARFLSMPTDIWSLRHYQALFDNPAWLQSIWLSLGGCRHCPCGDDRAFRGCHGHRGACAS
jgi:ABC-type spermidine/putrescine transport system permease subunit II